MGQVIPFIKDNARYRKLAEVRAEKNDFSGALNFLFSAKSVSNDYQVIMDIADAYADMGLLELSNKYWFMYMDKAPKDKVSVAYEELAINYFYLDNYWASSYYFHLKLTTDGQIMKEGLDPEIIEFFSGAELKKNAYRIVYPIERADYTFEIKRAKHALAIGAFPEAKKSLSVIPEERRTEETAGDLAVACFMSDDLEGAERVCRSSLSIHGDNVTAFSNLSTVYDMREDFDNAEFYYQKALDAMKGEKTEAYKIATCAIERGDHQTAKECLEDILSDRPYELSMRFFYGVALINLGKYDRANEQLKKVVRINPQDPVARYYAHLAELLEGGDIDAQKLLPLEYVKELPKTVVAQYAKRLKELASSTEKAEFALKREEVKRMVEWAVYCADGQVARDAAYLLSLGNSQYAKKLAEDVLMDPDAKEEIKRILVYMLVARGYKGKIAAVAGNFYVKARPKKLLCERASDGGVYFSAYALCMARAIFWDVENVDKIAKHVDKIYGVLRNKIRSSEVTNDEIAALVLSECKFKWCKSDRDVLNIFEVDKRRLELLRELYKGDKND